MYDMDWENVSIDIIAPQDAFVNSRFCVRSDSYFLDIMHNAIANYTFLIYNKTVTQDGAIHCKEWFIVHKESERSD